MKYLAIATILVASFVFAGCSVSASVEKIPGLANLVASDKVFTLNDDESDTTAEYEVLYTDLGFEPAEITVTPNTRVVFINQSADRVWIKSEQPFYSLKPTFDQKDGIKGGEWFSIVFKEAGTWKYQNYLNPDQKGLVVVEEE